MYSAKLRPGWGLRVGSHDLVLRSAIQGKAAFEVFTPADLGIAVEDDAHEETRLLLECPSGVTLRLGRALVHVRHARRGECQLAVDAPLEVLIERLHPADLPF